MVKDIIIFYYLPISIFVSYCCCNIIITIIYVIKKNKIIFPVLLFYIALTFISLMYIYPINLYIHMPHLMLFILIIFIGMYCLLVAMDDFTSTINTLCNTFYLIIAKSIFIFFSIIILLEDIHNLLGIIILSADMFMSFSMLFIKSDIISSNIHFHHRGSLLLMLLCSIAYCMIAMDSSIVVFSFHVFSVISACSIILVAKFLLSLCDVKSHNHLKIHHELLYTNEKYNLLIKKIKEHVKHYYNSPIDKNTIALQCEMHPDYITKVFKSEEGITINKYIQNVRLEKAHYLLLYSDKKIIEVAFDVGYENLATFYRHFVKRYKKSPQQIRKDKLNT